MKRQMSSDALVIAGVLVVLACADHAPTEPGLGSASKSPLALAISDAAHAGGTSQFLFLPPTVLSLRSGAHFTGPFDPIVNAVVRVCEGSGACLSGAALATFNATSGTGGGPLARVRMNSRLQSYSAVWDTRKCATGPCALDPTRAYRLHVYALNLAGAEVELGYADLQVIRPPSRSRPLPPLDLQNFSPLVIGLPYVIAFRVGQGIPGRITVVADAASVTPAGTSVLTATVRDLRDALLGGAAVTWSVVTTPAVGVVASNGPLTPATGQTGPSGTLAVTLTAGLTPGAATVTATSGGASASAIVTIAGPVDCAQQFVDRFPTITSPVPIGLITSHFDAQLYCESVFLTVADLAECIARVVVLANVTPGGSTNPCLAAA